MFVVLLGVVGPLFLGCDPGSGGLRSAEPAAHLGKRSIPAFFPDPDPAHPLGTESNGRDMLALLMAAAPGSLRVG